MPITITCPCGQQQFIAEARAGQTTCCVTCGKTLTVPAMGKLVSAKPKTPTRRSSSSNLVPALLIASVALAFVGAVSFLAWAIVERHREEQIAVGQAFEPDVPKSQPKKADLLEPLVQHKSEPAKKPAIIEPAPPVKETPKQVVEPIKPKLEAPKTVVVEPVKPKEPPPIEKKPINLIEPIKLVWKLKQEEVLFQELVVTQKPTYKVQGIAVAAFLQYRIVSRLTVTKRNDDGSLVVEQKIESAKLLQADELTRPTVDTAIAKMAGATYTLHLSPGMDVTKLEGGGADAKPMQIAGGLGMQMTSLIDRDGWKELHQATFFQLNDTPKQGARWSKPLSHGWGPLGSWNGQTHYLYVGQEKDLHKVTYGLQLAYKAPQAGVGLMPINGANFQPPIAGGVILFDAGRGRVIAAEERFRVRGIVNMNVLGQNTAMEIDEDQHFLIRIHDKFDAAAK